MAYLDKESFLEKVANPIFFTSLVILALLFLPMMSVDWTSTLTSESTTSLYFVWGGMNPDTTRIGLYGPTHFGALDSSFLIILSSFWLVGGIILTCLLYLLESEKSIHFLVFSSMLFILYLFIPHYFIESAILSHFQIQSFLIFPSPPILSIIGGFFKFLWSKDETEE